MCAGEAADVQVRRAVRAHAGAQAAAQAAEPGAVVQGDHDALSGANEQRDARGRRRGGGGEGEVGAARARGGQRMIARTTATQLPATGAAAGQAGEEGGGGDALDRAQGQDVRLRLQPPLRRAAAQRERFRGGVRRGRGAGEGSEVDGLFELVHAAQPEAAAGQEGEGEGARG